MTSGRGCSRHERGYCATALTIHNQQLATQMEAAKVEGFSDGVFAVAMTLLIFQVETPRFDEGKSNLELLLDLPL